MITLDNLSKSFGERTILEGASLRIGPRDRIGLVGANGAGKTTILRLIAGTEEADGGAIARTKGTAIGVLEQEHDLPPGKTLLKFVLGRSADLSALEREITVVNEELAKTSDQAAAEELAIRQGVLHDRFEALGGWEREHRARAVLDGLGFSIDDLAREVSEFSGGWRVRAGLAGLLVSYPDLLLLDEPTNHLDLESVVWLENFLASFPGAILLISHDRKLLNTLPTRTAFVDGGRLDSYEGNYDAFLKQREEEERLLEARARNQGQKIAQAERFIERFRAKATKASLVQSRIKSLEKLERIEISKSALTVSVAFPHPPRCGKDVVTLKGVSSLSGRQSCTAISTSGSDGENGSPSSDRTAPGSRRS